MVGRRPLLRTTLLAAVLVACAAAPAATADTRYGALSFPTDEHQHLGGWDYWWGAARIVTTSGTRYTVGLAYPSFDGYAAAGYQIFPFQGPYKGQAVMTQEGPIEWGHAGDGNFIERMSLPLPGNLLKLDTLDAGDGLK